MQDYQRRVIDEEAALADKLVKLVKFISSDAFKAVLPGDQLLLRAQRNAMIDYQDILQARIERFEVEKVD